MSAVLEPGQVNAEAGELSDMWERLDMQQRAKPQVRNFSESVFFDRVYSTTSLPLTSEKPLIYIVPGLKNYITDMSLIKHYARFRVVDTDGKPLAVEDEVTVKGSPLYSAFKDLHISWNGTTVFDSKGQYPQYINILLKTKDVKYLKDPIQYYDDTENMKAGVELVYDEDDPETVVARNAIWDAEDSVPSWNDRVGTWRFGNQVEVISSLYFDQLFQSRFLRDDIECRFTLNPASSESALFTTAPTKEYHLELMESHLVVPRFKLMPRYSLPKGKLQYYFVHHELSTHMLAAGVQNVQRQLRSGVLPRRVFFAMISEDPFMGSYHHSPYRYEHFDLKMFQLTAGSRKFPSEPLRMNWDSDQYLEAYQWFLTNTRSCKRLATGSISKDMYKTTDFLIAVDLTADLSAGSDYKVDVGTGPLSLAMQFETSLPHNVILLLVEEFESEIECTAHGQVIFKPQTG